MPNIVKTKEDEELWNHAKKIALKALHNKSPKTNKADNKILTKGDSWGFVMDRYKKLKSGDLKRRITESLSIGLAGKYVTESLLKKAAIAAPIVAAGVGYLLSRDSDVNPIKRSGSDASALSGLNRSIDSKSKIIDKISSSITKTTDAPKLTELQSHVKRNFELPIGSDEYNRHQKVLSSSIDKLNSQYANLKTDADRQSFLNSHPEYKRIKHNLRVARGELPRSEYQKSTLTPI
jgi:hypothetical protein